MSREARSCLSCAAAHSLRTKKTSCTANPGTQVAFAAMLLYLDAPYTYHRHE